MSVEPRLLDSRRAAAGVEIPDDDALARRGGAFATVGGDRDRPYGIT